MTGNEMKSELLSAEDVRELLDYDQETGVFVWKIKRNNRTRAGQLAGAIEIQGYLVIKIHGKTYKAHRLAWLITHGSWPSDQIDHIDHCRENNRLSNLREVTNTCNHQNKSFRKVNTSGVTGVTLHAGKWQARIGVNGKRISLGHFDSLEEASLAKALADAKYGFHRNHGKEL